LYSFDVLQFTVNIAHYRSHFLSLTFFVFMIMFHIRGCELFIIIM